MNETTKYKMLIQREMMKGYTTAYVHAESTDQQQKLPAPPALKAGRGGKTIPLPMDFEDVVSDRSIASLFRERESHRKYKETPIPLKTLSFLLWAVQGVRKLVGRTEKITFRTVPSAGSRHPLETYLFIRNVEGVSPGIYHYLPSGHQLELWEDAPDYKEELTEALNGQEFAAAAPLTFVWSAVPYRTEWRYGWQSHKYILLDAGHVCENLYLACEASGCGACAIGSYNQELLDELLGFMPGPSGEKDYEFAVYVASVGAI